MYRSTWWLSSPGSAHVPTHGHGCRPRLFVLVYEKRFFHLFCLILNVPSLVAQFHLPARTQTHTHIFANQATPTARVDQSKISSNCCCQKMSSICQLSLLIMSEFSSGRRESGIALFVYPRRIVQYVLRPLGIHTMTGLIILNFS